MKLFCCRPKSTASEYTPILGEEEEEEERCFAGIPARYVLVVLGFFGIFNVYTMRVNLSVALVAMVQKPIEEVQSAMACVELLPNNPTNNSSVVGIPKHQGEFDWDSTIQGVVLGSFFYGYVITQIPGGMIAEKFGAKWIFGSGILMTAICTLLSPLAARWHVGALIAARILEGLGEGVTYPAMNALIGRWVPKLERSRFATFIYTGSPIGTVVSMSLSGILSDSTFLGGWPSAFYVFGAVSFVWFILWILLIYESPDEHPRITKSELNFIHQGQDHAQNRIGPVPWREIFSSKPFIALIITHFCYNWGFYTMLTEMPTYLSNVLHFDVKKNGILSALPYLIQAFFAVLASIIADKLRATGYYSITSIRKVMNSIAFYGPGVIIFSISLAGCNPTLIVALLTLSVGLNGFIFSGFNVTHVDMSPELAGTLMGITNCVANVAGFLSPAFVGKVVENGQTPANWAIVFTTTAAIYFVAGTIFNIFASAEPQPWGITEPAPSLENPDDRSTPAIENDRRNSG